MGLLRIKRNLEKRDYRKSLQLFSCSSTTILKFLGIVVSTYNYRVNGKKKWSRDTGVGVPWCRALWGTRGAAVWEKYGVPGSVQSMGCGINKLNKNNVSVTTLKHFNENSTGTFELKSWFMRWKITILPVRNCEQSFDF